MGGDKSPSNARRGGGVKGGAAAEGHPSRQSHSTHHTEEVTVHYPWHPLYGQPVVVQRSVRQGREVWLCEPDQRTAAIPVWITDRVACAALSTGPVLVSVDALIELASLVAASRSAHDRITHPSQEEPDATSTSDTRVEQLLTVAEAAQCVGSCEETIRRAYLARQLDVLRFGARRVRIRPSALVAWLERGGKTTAA